jgi:hypothetical protein
MNTFSGMGIEAFPLCWPAGWLRARIRKNSAFRATFPRAREELFRELRLLGVEKFNTIISSNIPVRRDGLPYATSPNPRDPGVAVYFRYKNKPMVFACDQYELALDNLIAIAKTIEAMRGIKRWGASEMLERSFSGFAALPPPRSKDERQWWEILEVPKFASREEIKSAWLRLAKEKHPDKGGSAEEMAKINQAYEQGMRSR